MRNNKPIPNKEKNENIITLALKYFFSSFKNSTEKSKFSKLPRFTMYGACIITFSNNRRNYDYN